MMDMGRVLRTGTRRVILLIFMFFMCLLIVIYPSCRAAELENVTPAEIGETEDLAETGEEAETEETGENGDPKEEPETSLEEEETEPEIEEDISVNEEEIIGIIVIDFIQAVASDEEYGYFSSDTIDMVGTEDEYRNGGKSDIYFIIKESHSSWENIKITGVRIDGDLAEADIMGDRMAEGMKYEGDQVTFKLIKEENSWKIDFSS